MFGNVAPGLLVGVAGFRKESIALDRIFESAITAAMRERKTCAAPTARWATTGEVDQSDSARGREAAGVVERDGRTHRMADQVDIVSAEKREHRFEIGIESADVSLGWVAGVAMATEIECEDGAVR